MTFENKNYKWNIGEIRCEVLLEFILALNHENLQNVYALVFNSNLDDCCQFKS
jgi:hypothetical protein